MTYSYNQYFKAKMSNTKNNWKRTKSINYSKHIFWYSKRIHLLMVPPSQTTFFSFFCQMITAKLGSSNFVDLQKAFHNFEHDILLVKLVLINDHVSNKVTVKYEVPRVYVCGPHLFMIHMSNLNQVIKAHHFTDNRNNRNLLQFKKFQ